MNCCLSVWSSMKSLLQIEKQILTGGKIQTQMLKCLL